MSMDKIERKIENVEKDIAKVVMDIEEITKRLENETNKEEKKELREDKRRLGERERQLMEEKLLLLRKDDEVSSHSAMSGPPQKQPKLDQESLYGSIAYHVLPPPKRIKLEGTSEGYSMSKIDKEHENFLQRHKSKNIMDDTPNFKMLMEMYEKYRTVDINTLVIIGPKGCGKTASLYSFCNALTLGRKTALYIDLAKFGRDQTSVIALTEQRTLDVLLIDNVQMYDHCCGNFECTTFIVAASSPGGGLNKNIKKFIKARGDGQSRQLYFTPFTLEFSRKLLEHLDVVVEDAPITEVGGNVDVTHSQSKGEGPCYITRPPKRDVRTRREKEKRKTRSGLAQLTSASYARDETSTESTTFEATSKTESTTFGTSTGVTTHKTSTGSTTLETSTGDEIRKSLTWEQFLEVHYYTGGIARYLYNYVVDGHHQYAYAEVKGQMMDFIDYVGGDKAWQSVLDVALTSKVDPLSDILQHGLAYIASDGSVGHLSTPMLINMVVKHKGLEIGSSVDWANLELLTLFMLEHTEPTISNCFGHTIKVHRPTQRYDQQSIGFVPSSFKSDPNPNILIRLACKHPVVDAILVCHLARIIYFIQTSFSTYSKHKTKKADLFTKQIQGTDIFSHYHDMFGGKYNSIYIYATPQCQQNCIDDDQVYFLDLKEAVFRW